MTWHGPALVLFARSALGIATHAIVAGIFAWRGSPFPWRAAEPWLPVYAVIIDAGCLLLLWKLTQREGSHLFDLVGFKRKRLASDLLLGLALIPISLAFIFAGTAAAGWLVYGAVQPPVFLGGLPLPAAIYGILVFPVLWGLTEQMTYNGYALPRLQNLSRNTFVAVAVVAFVWSLEHAFLPPTFDPQIMTFRTLSALPHSLFQTMLYLRIRRLVPLVFAHALMDGATVLIPLLSD